MPSVTDVPQQTSNIHGKTTPPPPSSSSTTQQATSSDATSGDAMTQSIQVLEKKLRNLGKRKEKLVSYEQDEKKGKELNKDQKEALAKFPEVIGQIESVKELIEQLKKIQADAQKIQKRLAKQAMEEKRLQIYQRVTEYAQLRYLLDHRPDSLTEEESTLLDQLSSVIIPTDNSQSVIGRSVDVVLSIYQGGPAAKTIKALTGKTAQEVQEILEKLLKNSSNSSTGPSTNDVQTNDEQVDDTQQILSQPTSTITDTQATTTTTTSATSAMDETHENVSNPTTHEYPLKFDTREQSIPLEQIIHDSTFLNEPIQSQPLVEDHHLQQGNHSDEYLATNTMLSSNNPDQTSSLISNLEQTNLSATGPSSTDQPNQSHEEQWQQPRTNNNIQRNNPYNQNNRYQNRPPNNYHSQSNRGGPRGGRYNNSYVANQSGAGPRPHYDNTNRGRPGHNPHYRGNHGGQYRGGHRGNGAYHQGNGNNYQKGQYYSNNEQHVRSAPPNTSSGDHQ